MPKSRKLFALLNIYVPCTLLLPFDDKNVFYNYLGRKKNRWKCEGRRERGPGRKTKGGRGGKEEISP